MSAPGAGAAPRVRRRRTRVVAAVAASLTACLLVAVGPAVLADDDAALKVRRVDATDAEQVEVDLSWTGDRAALEDLTIREDGKERPVESLEPLPAVGVHPAVMAVVDTSASMARNGGLEQVQSTLRRMIEDLDDGEAMGIVAFGSSARKLAGVTSDKAGLLDAVDELIAPEDADTAMWDGLRLAAAQLPDDPELQNNLLLITDGFDDASETSRSQAGSEVARAGAALFAVPYGPADQVDVEGLSALVDRVGGAVLPASEDDLGQVLTGVKESLASQYRATFESQAEQGGTELAVSVGGETVKTTFVAGALAEGEANLAPPARSRSLVPSFVRGDLGLILVVGAGGLAIALAAAAVILIFTRDDNSLDKVLQQYTEPGVTQDDDDQGIVQSAFVQRAVDLTEELADRQGLLLKVEAKLEQADLPLRAAEALFFYAAVGIVLSVLGLIVGGLFGLLAVGLFAFLAPLAVLNFLGARRRKQFEAQLPDTLKLLSGSLRAGYSLIQGVEAVAEEVDGPMGRELRRVMTEARLGRELEEALDGAAARVQSKDFEWAIMAVRIQREVGGNLSELLDTVAETMVSRERLRRDINSLTAEGKISAFVLGLLPVALGIVLFVMNADYMSVLFTDTAGKVMLGAGTISALIGFAWMKKCITIEV